MKKFIVDAAKSTIKSAGVRKPKKGLYLSSYPEREEYKFVGDLKTEETDEAWGEGLI